MNAVALFFISFSIALRQKSVSVSLSICNARLIDFGISIPNLWVRKMYLRLFIFSTLRSRWRRKRGTHQANTGSWTNLLATAYSATSMGLDSLMSFKGTQLDPPSFHSTKSDHPLVVHRRCLVLGTKPSSV